MGLLKWPSQSDAQILTQLSAQASQSAHAGSHPPVQAVTTSSRLAVSRPPQSLLTPRCGRSACSGGDGFGAPDSQQVEDSVHATRRGWPTLPRFCGDIRESCALKPLRYNRGSMIRISRCTTALRAHVGQTLHWLPWLVVALACTLVLWPNPVTASRLAFQSVIIYDESPLSVSPLPAEQPAAELPPPAPEPALPGEPAVPEAPPIENNPEAVPPTAAEPVPVQPLPEPPSAPATEAPRVPTRAVPPGLLIDQPPAPVPQPRERAQETPAAPGISQSVINWTKFWDTVVVVVAYPWLCCGILLLLGVPLALLLLEIKGRRRPPKLPESPVRQPSSSRRNPEL